jgi:Kdo2-lipid IVA lauroyltransferase/acyltransferase
VPGCSQDQNRAGKYFLKLINYLLIRITSGFLRLLPVEWQRRLVAWAGRLIGSRLSRFERVSLTNLKLAFPEKTEAWRRQVFSATPNAMARLLVDFLRLDKLDQNWVQSHVKFPAFSELEKLRAVNPDKGIILATGHLGSFELLAHSFVSYSKRPVGLVVRDFKNPRIDNWWYAKREANGNRTIPREGAYKRIIYNLKHGIDVGILFDQNVRNQHAVFVDWFGRPAATTRAIGLAALQTGAPVVVISISNLDDDQYQINAVHCDYNDIIGDSQMDKEDKVQAITQRVSDEFCKMIKDRPEEWFWMHRRWKTTPPGQPENLYEHC